MADRTPLKVGLKYLIPVLAMGLVILASNELVQHPVQAIVWSVNLSSILTWGAFTYPIAFLVTDTTNRVFGVGPARKVVYVGFVFGVALTLGAALALARSTRSEGMSLLAALLHDDEAFAMFRIALASGSAFLVAQLLDIQVFDWLRRGDWWKAPVASSFIGSLVDTVIFFFSRICRHRPAVGQLGDGGLRCEAFDDCVAVVSLQGAGQSIPKFIARTWIAIGFRHSP